MISLKLYWAQYWVSQVAQWLKNSSANARPTGDTGSTPGWRRSPGGGNGYPLWYSGVNNIIS